MKTVIKWASTTLKQVAAAGKVAIQQVSYMGKGATVSTWTPYGMDSSPPPGQLTLLFSILGNSDNQVGLVGSPGEGPEKKLTEVVYFHPPTGSKIHFLADGSILTESGAASFSLTPSGGISITPGTSPVVVNGDMTVNGALVVNGSLTITGVTTLAAVTSNGVNISGTHLHDAGTYLDSGAGAVTGSSGVPS